MLAFIILSATPGEPYCTKPYFHCCCTEASVNHCFLTGLLYNLWICLSQDPPQEGNAIERSLFTWDSEHLVQIQSSQVQFVLSILELPGR